MLEREPSGIAERMRDELEHLRAQSQFRALENPEGISLCSNDYLGLATDPRLQQAVMDEVARGGAMGATGSRLLSGNSRPWEQLESEFARFAGTEAALYFGAGYAANVGLLSSILQPGDTVFSDALNHASLIDGMRLSGARKMMYPHLDLGFLEKSLREEKDAPGAKVIVTESVFSMEGDIAPLGELLSLAREYGADVVVDEAHATGVCGPQGRGIAAEYKCERDLLASVHTCGKALASAGAFVCGENVLRQFLVNRARTFIFSTAMPPYLAGQIGAALELVRQADAQRAQLREIASLLRAALAARGLQLGASATHIVPVILGTNEKALYVAAQLQASGFAAKAIRPPTVPAGTSRIRLCLTIQITTEDVQRIVAIIAAASQSFPQANVSSPMHA
ncbi:MAG: 8-amino-7-oxononanoate synthase [Candidatus Acidiferrales bacterium]